MQIIRNQEFGGERPLYASHDLRLENVTIHVGESSIKESSNIEAENCRFEGKYVFWETYGFKVRNCYFAESARSSLWYSKGAHLVDCQVDAPKMFRRMQGVEVERTQFPNALETHNAVINSKDAFWESENVTIYDSEINGEYLAWYGKNIRLVRCHLTGEQLLCYVDGLILEDCTFGEDANLLFEYSTLNATIKGNVTSIKNPTSGHIAVQGKVGEIIFDKNQKQPANATIVQL